MPVRTFERSKIFRFFNVANVLGSNFVLKVRKRGNSPIASELVDSDNSLLS
jgi:hypothetical protein